MILTRVLAPLASAAMIFAIATPALAADSAESRMMTKKDVPASFGTPTSFDFDAKLAAKTIGICDNAEGKTLVSVPAPGAQYLVDVETKNKKTYTDVMERVYKFDNNSAASAAFTQLSSNLATCNGTSTMTSQTPSLTQTVTTGSYPGGEYEDFWVNVAGTWTGGQECKKACRTVVNAVYTLAGDAIVETVGYINGRGKMTSAQSNGLAQLAQVLAARWVG